ncbi:serine-aspartate repeat-containing protein [Pseudomonas amygdali pv. mori str. 301020]|uniref:Serine-aspartate repeat-containing protein n=2 Tax=Pseudomonas amygdali pv. mori TaxID=34065 RepID=A0A0N8S489_PSEA0|nr:serine-aspartate repeat-containing protein [Pseudomonas amygdali pv. mori str. 301020]KPX89719.1 Serine-aspartate repeat-containing protein [Pseudomonas amygdali pv. mori]
MRVYNALTAKIGGLLLVLTMVGTSLPAYAVNDCDMDNDNSTDARCGGNDKDLDNDNVTDAAFGGNDKDMDNDHHTDAAFGGTDRDLDNDNNTDKYHGSVPSAAKK